MLGGTGTSQPVQELWVLGTNGSPSGQDFQDSLPFTKCSEIPLCIPCPPKPIIKTSSLPEFRLQLPDSVFIDRKLPAPAQPLTAHPRFTPAYYVALHNLAASSGHDGHGNYYPANTPNFKGARLPLVHTNLNIDSWRKHLIGYEHDTEILQFMQYGFPLGLVDSPKLVPCERNHGSSYQFYPHLDKFVTSEILHGGLTGPFTTAPWPNIMISPVMTAPKKPDSRRPVFDATFGGASLNNSTPSDHYMGTPTVYTYPKVDDLRRIILTCGRGCYMWKRDLHRFYLQIPMDPVDFSHVGFVWRGLIFFFVCLMFGLRHSGYQGQRITDALAWIHRQSGLDTDDEVPFNCINYCDDLGGAEGSIERANLSFNRLGTLLGDLGLAESIDKARPPSTDMVYLGVHFNTTTMVMSVPPDKLAEVKEEIEKEGQT